MNTTYLIETRPSLTSRQWMPVSTNKIANNGFNLIISAPTNRTSSIFYRAMWLTNIQLNQ
jgi:hypothetical protein